MKIFFDGVHGTGKSTLITKLIQVINGAIGIDLDQFQFYPADLYAGEVARVLAARQAIARCTVDHIYLFDRGPYSPILYTIALGHYDQISSAQVDSILDINRTYPADLSDSCTVYLHPSTEWVMGNIAKRGAEADDIMFENSFIINLNATYEAFYAALAKIAFVVEYDPEHESVVDFVQRLQIMRWLRREDIKEESGCRVPESRAT